MIIGAERVPFDISEFFSKIREQICVSSAQVYLTIVVVCVICLRRVIKFTPLNYKLFLIRFTFIDQHFDHTDTVRLVLVHCVKDVYLSFVFHFEKEYLAKVLQKCRGFLE